MGLFDLFKKSPDITPDYAAEAVIGTSLQDLQLLVYNVYQEALSESVEIPALSEYMKFLLAETLNCAQSSLNKRDYKQFEKETISHIKNLLNQEGLEQLKKKVNSAWFSDVQNFYLSDKKSSDFSKWLNSDEGKYHFTSPRHFTQEEKYENLNSEDQTATKLFSRLIKALKLSPKNPRTDFFLFAVASKVKDVHNAMSSYTYEVR